MSTRDDDIYSPLSAALQAFPDVHEPTPQHSSTQTAPVKSAKMKPRESDEPGNGKEDKKSAINRVNRACNHCRKMKMRCVGAEDPPCKRCASSGLDCVLEKPSRDAPGEERMRVLETQVSSMQDTLMDLVTALRSNIQQGNVPVLPVQPPDSLTPEQLAIPSNLQGSSTLPLAHETWQKALMNTAPAEYPAQIPPSMSNARGDRSSEQMSTERASPVDFWNHSQQGSSSSRSAVQPQIVHLIGDGDPSLPPSRDASDVAEDMLGGDEIINPLGALSNMAELVEAAAERAREEQARRRGDEPRGKRGASHEARQTSPATSKKARFQSPPQNGHAVQDSQRILSPGGTIRNGISALKSHVHAFPDAISEEILTEEEGKELMRIYYDGSHDFIPCYDPQHDTWESLRQRSPFSITTLCMIGAQVRDGGGPPSELQLACRQHARRIATSTLFNPVNRIEAVQAMMLLASFSDDGWLPLGHAVRMAIDMGINRSFERLLRDGMGKGMTQEQIEEDRPLVVHSRVWFCLYLAEHQMSYGLGRPAILREDSSIHHCRRLLEHPLSIESDARLVSTVELAALRSPLHVELTMSPLKPVTESLLARLKQANTDFDSWERFWTRILADRFGRGKEDFYAQSLGVQRQFAELFVNSQLLRGIRNPQDVLEMPEEKRLLAIRAMRNAQQCLDACLNKQNYRKRLAYAVHYTHVCAAFAASFLIRIARLFPHELDLKKTARDVEGLAQVLSGVPAGRYARSLRLILRRARRDRIIPDTSRANSPQRVGPPADPYAPTFSPSQLINPSYYRTSTSTQRVNDLTLAPRSILDDSPTSGGDIWEFDALLAQQTLEQAGLKMDEGDHLPLFLDGQSLGAAAAPLDLPYVGLEDFFLPADVDNRLAGPDLSLTNGTSDPSTQQQSLGSDIWW